MKTTNGRERKEISLYLRNGVYYARLWDPESGRYSSAKSTGLRDRDEAYAHAKAMKGDGQFQPRAQDPALADFITDYWKTTPKQLSAKYRDDSIFYAGKIEGCPALRGVRRSTVKAFHLNRLKDYLEYDLGFSGRVVNRALQAAIVPLRWAFSRGLIANDPTRGVEKAQVESRERGILTLDELEKILALKVPVRHKAIIAFPALAGLRKGEVRGLLWKDIDLETRTIYVRHNWVDDAEGLKTPKAKSAGRAPIVDALAEIIEALKKESPYRGPSDFVVYQAEREKPVPDITISRVFHRALEKIGITDEQRDERHLVYHGLRHFFATLARKELPDFIAARLTRHKSARMLDNYSHTTESDFEEAKKRLNKRIG